ncbi:hypothetical protein SAMN04487914_111143 [Arthrobacter sp. ok909]|uniref:hypothetical protein n=1 Tax=Arthrobacter sp. ok909 TaxID=1761746 RepID=UPI0008851349|nr:hypothetical protein [Arthrobacter sp. ok909]SDP44505.1 hypothetical protein SAMN04487914_111143 [Arthrobacter sp. ok909]
MDPVTLGVVAAGLISKFYEGALSKAVEEASKGLVDWIKGRFKGHEAGERALARVEDAPDSTSRVKALEGIIEEQATADPDFLDQLAKLLEKAQPTAVQGHAATSGAQSPAFGQISGGNVSVDYGTTPPPPAPLP